MHETAGTHRGELQIQASARWAETKTHRRQGCFEEGLTRAEDREKGEGDGGSVRCRAEDWAGERRCREVKDEGF